jgi:RNA polymerase sigma factor (sigma-70 family)
LTDVLLDGPSTAGPSWWSERERSRLVRLCEVLVGDRCAAEDLAQETLLEAWRHRAKLVEPSGAGPWLDAIARNVCRRWLRTRGRIPRPVEDSLLGDVRAPATEDIDVVLEQEELADLLDRALALLPDDTRDALVARYVEEKSPTEIAAALGVSADAVSMRLSRGKLRLRFLLETTFAEDAVAEGWVRRSDAGWRPTRLRCVECGGATVQIQRDPGGKAVSFRCATCDPHGVSVRLPLDNPVFGRLVGDLRRPSAILARSSAWLLDYWSPSDPPRAARCSGCGSSVDVQAYSLPGPASWSCRHGWYVACETCGEELSSSLGGLALALPEVISARRRDPRLRSLPVREVERDGERAMVVGFAGRDGIEQVSAVFSRVSKRLMHVSARQAPAAQAW